MRELKVGEIVRFRHADYIVVSVNAAGNASERYTLDAYITQDPYRVAGRIFVSEKLDYWAAVFNDASNESYGVFSIDQSPLVKKVKSMMDEVKAKMPVIDCTCDIMSNAKVYDGMHAKMCRRK